MNRDGSGKTQLTDSPFERESGATWSPAGNQIAFSLFRSVDGDEEIFVMNSDGSGVQKVTDNELRDYQPSWSPDGTRIAFTQLDALDSSINDIVLINVDGTGETSLTGGASSNSHPAWSPSGDRIAFGSDRDSDENFMRCAVYVMDVDGANVLRLTEPTQAQCSFLDEFRWSPDGSRIAVLRTPDGKATTPAEIWIVEADGSGAVNVTNNGPARDYAPVWSPDGTRIVFGSDRSGDNELYIMNADGSNVIQLADPGGIETAVEWK